MWFIGLITGLAGPIAQITNKILDLQAQKANTTAELEKKRIEREIEEAHDRKAVLVAEAGSRLASGLNAIMRTALALPVAIILWKLLAYDKVLGSFKGCAGKQALVDCITYKTDPLDAYQWYVIGAVIAFYFMYDMFARLRK